MGGYTKKVKSLMKFSNYNYLKPAPTMTRVAVFNMPYGHSIIVPVPEGQIPERYMQEAYCYRIGMIDMEAFNRLDTFAQTEPRVYYGTPISGNELYQRMLALEAVGETKGRDYCAILTLGHYREWFSPECIIVRTDHGRYFKLEPGELIEPTDPGEISVHHKKPEGWPE